MVTGTPSSPRPSGSGSGPGAASTTPTSGTPRWAASSRWPHGRGWFDVVRDELLEPLGMTRTTTRPSGSAALGLAVHPFADLLLPEPEHDAGAMAPAGQLWTTVPDLARWATFLGGETAGLLAAETLAEMVEPHHVVDDPGQPWVAAHGLGFQVWNVGGARFAGHGGSMPGFLAGLRVRLDAGVPANGFGSGAAGGGQGGHPASGPALGAAGDGVVLFTNTTASTATRSTVDDLLDTLARREPAPVEPWSAGGNPTRCSTSWARGTGVLPPSRPRSSASTWCSASRERPWRAVPAGRHRRVAGPGLLLRGRAPAGGAPR